MVFVAPQEVKSGGVAGLNHHPWPVSEDVKSVGLSS